MQLARSALEAERIPAYALAHKAVALIAMLKAKQPTLALILFNASGLLGPLVPSFNAQAPKGALIFRACRFAKSKFCSIQ